MTGMKVFRAVFMALALVVPTFALASDSATPCACCDDCPPNCPCCE
jgi:hypothetical protein